MHPGCFRDRDLSHDRLDRRRVHDGLPVRRLGLHLELHLDHLRERCRVLRLRLGRGLGRACSAQSSSSSTGSGEVRPDVVPDVVRLRPLRLLRVEASDLASAFPVPEQRGCCLDERPDRPDRLGGYRTWGHRVRLASAFPVQEQRGCCLDEQMNAHLAWRRHRVSEQHPAWGRHRVSEQHLAWERPNGLQVWSLPQPYRLQVLRRARLPFQSAQLVLRRPVLHRLVPRRPVLHRLVLLREWPWLRALLRALRPVLLRWIRPLASTWSQRGWLLRSSPRLPWLQVWLRSLHRAWGLRA